MSDNPQPDLPTAPASPSSAQVDGAAPVSGFVAPAPAQPDPQPELFDEGVYTGGQELLVPESVQLRQFTTERVQRNQARFAAILRALGEGMPQTQIARAYGVSRNTLGAIIARHPHLVERERRMTAGLSAVLARGCAEKMLEMIDRIPANVLPIVMGIATDKSLLLDGRPTAITETKRGPTADELNAYIDSLPRAQVSTSDAQSDENGQNRLRLGGPRPAGSASGAGTPVQKGLDVPVDGDQAGAAADLGAAEQGGGGGRDAQAGGATSMDPSA